MPCTKKNKCNKESCLCLPTKGSCICVCENEMGDITRCGCKCERNLCKCGNKCTCVNTSGYSCICVCRDEQGKVTTCKRCSCEPKQVASCKVTPLGNCECKGQDEKGENPCICVCSNEKGNIMTCEGCSCVPEQGAVSCKSATDKNCGCKCDGKNCVCLSLGGDICICHASEKGNIKTCGGCVCKLPVVSGKGTYAQAVKLSNDGASNACKCQGNAHSCVCLCKNEQGETVCCEDCNCDKNNRCDKKGCTCVPKQSNIDVGKYVKCVRFENTDSFSCVCENKQGELVCCDDCKCDDNSTCDKKGCTCVPKGSTTCIKVASSKTDCFCKISPVSCVCVCKNEQGELVCCDDCKCDDNNKCDKKGCVCVPKGYTTCIKAASLKTDCFCKTSPVSCDCVCKNEQGKLVCCDDCKCDDNNKCDKEGCVCVPKGSSTSIKAASSQTYCLCKTSTNSCICVCKNKQGKLVCCDDCKCDVNSTCDKIGCTCVPKGSTTCIKAASSKTDCFCKISLVSCVCVCKNEQGELVCCDDCKCDDNNKCDKKGCVCVPKGYTTCIKAASLKTDCFCKTSPVSCDCVCKNEQGKLVCCDDCKCDDNNKCDKEGCVCVPKGSSTSIKAASSQTYCLCKTSTNSCICVCKNKQGKLVCCDDCKCDVNSTCDKIGCTCVPKGSTTCIKAASSKTDCFCKISLVSCVCVCKNEQGELVCCDDCKCDDNNKCDKEGCVCVPKGSSTSIKATSSQTYCLCKTSTNSCICVCKNKQGELVCCDDCKCDNNNKCDKKGCTCVPKGSTTCIKVASLKTDCFCKTSPVSCVCVCKNEQGESVCCDDCKCDDNNKCDKEGCVCVPKGSSTSMKAASSQTYCLCKTSTNSCICVCKNKQGKLVCCDDCKCDVNSTCDKIGCTCVPKGSTTCIKAASSKTDCFCKISLVSCVCVCKNEQGELVCCDDCKCDDNNKCDKKGCTCVSKGSTTCIKASSSKTDCFCKISPVSCVCVCKNEQGELVCCDDCTCDDNNKCDKEGCVCVPKESNTCERGCSCISKGSNTGICKM